MGSDLYNHLIRYFVGHLKTLREVRHLFLFFLLSRVSDPSHVRSHPTASKMRPYYGTTRRNGIGTLLVQTTSIDYSHTSTDIGSNVSETRGGKASIRSIRYVYRGPLCLIRADAYC